MGLLQDDYWKSAAQTPTVVAPQPLPQPEAVPAPAPVAPVQAPVQSTPTTFSNPFDENAKKIVSNNQLSREEQVQRFGGEIGSAQYYQTKAAENPYMKVGARLGGYAAAGAAIGAVGGPVGIAVGALIGAGIGAASFPDENTWDSLSTVGKLQYLANSGSSSAVKMVVGLPAEIAKTPIRFATSVAAPWVDLAKGKSGSLESLAGAPQLEVPLLGKVPTYFQSYKEATDSGLGPIGAALATGGTALGDAVLIGALGEAAAAAMQPRAAVTAKVGESSVKNIEPVRAQIVRDSATNRTLGVTRQAEGSATEYYTLPKSTAQQFGGNSGNTFFKLTPYSPDSVELSIVQTRGGAIQKGVDYLRGTKTTAGDFGPEIKMQSQVIKLGEKPSTFVEEGASPITIPNSVTKGLENKTITNDQLSNLGRIGDANGIAPEIRDAVIRSVTGKNAMGEMTQGEYVRAAQTLGLFNGADKYVPKDAFLNPASQYLSPQRRWMRSYEESSGIPVYSEAYVPLENAVRARDVFRDVWRGKAREVFGKYAGSGFSAERQAISSYLQGETSAIVGNQAFSASARSEMLNVANGLRQLYNEVGPQLGVAPEIFLKDYQPHIQNIGGIFQLYKEGSTIPKSIDFFAKFKRKGSPTAPLIDDSLALFDIYVNAGSNSTFVTPALDRIAQFSEVLPSTVRGSVKSYVQEKLGYAGRMEQAMDEMVPAINKKLGINLPPDTARQFGDLVLSTQYSGLLSQPATWFRQMFQYPMFGYARLGPDFATEAYSKALTKAGVKEVADKGFLVDLGYPYGGALADEGAVGGRVLTSYKRLTQAPIAPNSTADNIQRAVVYHQFKMQFENALTLFNQGKIPWTQFENKVGMSSFSPIDQNIARQKIVNGDIEGAFDHLVRDVIDETQFPYRKAASPRVGYGFGGKVVTSLLNWPIEATHTVGSWFAQGARTGDFSKIIRYFAASTAIQRSMEGAFGLDFTRSLYLGPLLTSNFVAPIPQLAGNLFGMIMNSPWVGALGGANNRQLFNENKDKVLQTLNSSGYPAALEIKNIQRFKRSIERGPDESGQYAALDDKGNVKYYTDFSGIFMGELMGFPIDKKVSESLLNQQMFNAQEDQKAIKEKVMELLQQEKYDDASTLMAQYGVKVTPQDLDDYYIPRTQRTFQSLPASLKAQFAPRVFPDAFNEVQ